MELAVLRAGVDPGGQTPEQVAIESETGRINVEIIATLLGGMLLICSFVAQWLWDSAFYWKSLGSISAVLLGAPLVWVAIKDLMKGKAEMNALVALAVFGAFAMGEYQESAAIAFFMILAVLIGAVGVMLVFILKNLKGLPAESSER